MRRLTFARRSAPIAPAGPLRGQHEVHAERPALRRQPGQRRGRLRHVLGERPQLVDDHEQPRGRLGACGVELGQVARAGGHEHPLAAAQLGAQPAEHAVRVRRVEVRDVLEDVRQPRDRRPARSRP